MQRLVWWLWPRYTLPDCVIVKLRSSGHIEAFENEQATYRKLAPLQGDLIPRFYGEALVERDDDDKKHRKYLGGHTWASVISFLPWPNLFQQPEPVLTVQDFQARIEVAVDAIMAHGVVHIDEKLDNILLHDDGRILFIDLEITDNVGPGNEPVQRLFTVVAFVENYMRFLTARAADRGEPPPPAPRLWDPPPEVKALLPPQRPQPVDVTPIPKPNVPIERRGIPVPSPDEVAEILRSRLSEQSK
ncbi:hypothetical protein SEUCBS139899_007101 [Sporothrix eucalyptigena]|uniref:Protein kinase domain-containing protein n=1 Tax=Sporothrix eucalyptigena TaxID=1812306 RepID=A0ABP0CNI0_9PEZI